MEKWEIVISICSAILGSTALVSLVQFLIQRHDKKKEDKKGKLEAINEKLEKLCNQNDELIKNLEDTKVDLARTNLMLLIASYPTNVDETLHVGYKYFVDYKGDSYMTPIFGDWLVKQHIETPAWFIPEK